MSRQAEPTGSTGKAFALIETYIQKKGRPPSRAHMAEELGVSLSRVTAILTQLEREGRIELDSRVSWLTLPGYELRPRKK